MKVKKNFTSFNVKQYLSTSGIIKICIKIILICAIILLILESKEPTKYSIEEIKSLNVNTPVTINGQIQPIYSQESFSIVNISQNNATNHIIGTISQNSSKMPIDENKSYSIVGKVSIYESEKQIEIFQIKEIK